MKLEIITRLSFSQFNHSRLQTVAAWIAGPVREREIIDPAGVRAFRFQRLIGLMLALLLGAALGASAQRADDCELRITRQPSDLTAFAGQIVTFTVAAEGTPAPTTYLWQWWGPGSEPFTNIPPATGASVTLPVSLMGNGAQIRCVVGNDCTKLTSATATLTVLPSPMNRPPVLAAIPNQSVHAGTEIRFHLPAHDLDGPTDTLIYVPEMAPPGASLDPVTGEFLWTPTAADIGTSNLVVVSVTDNGLPPLGDSQGFFITVAAPPVIVDSSLTGDGLRLTWTSMPGNTYRIEAANDLTSPVWMEAVGDLSAQDTLASWELPRPEGGFANRYYRVALVAAVNAPVDIGESSITNRPAWTCCERDIEFPKTCKVGTDATTGLTNNNTRRFVIVDVKVPLKYSCADVAGQECIADLAVKVVFRPRQADAKGEYVNDVEEEIIETIRTDDPPKCDDKKHTTEVTIRWRGTYKARQDIKGTLNLELSVPGAKGNINHTLSVEVASANSRKAENPVLKEKE